MQPDLTISSKENPTFRFAQSLHRRKKAKETDTIFLEGSRLCEDVLNTGWVPEQIFYTQNKEALVSDWRERFFRALPEAQNAPRICLVVDHLFPKLCDTENPQGVAMILPRPTPPETLPSKGNDIYLVCERVTDPGNLGTMIRMADAFSFSGILLVAGGVDPYNEKVMRASMGSCFRLPICTYPDTETCIQELNKSRINSIGMDLSGESLDTAVIPFPVAYWIGNEAAGLTETAKRSCQRLIHIPMDGTAESLNAASAASITGYVLAKQRRERQKPGTKTTKTPRGT